MAQIEFESTVAGGFPVLVRCEMEGPDRSVGIMDSHAVDFEFRTLKGGDASFIEKKITRLDWDNLEIEAYEHDRYDRENSYDI